MKESDRDWWQEKTDEASGFHASSTFDTRPLMRPAPKRRRAKPRRARSYRRVAWVGLAVIALVALLVWLRR